MTKKINNIEFRRGNAGGGNQLRQPYLKNYLKKKLKKSIVLLKTPPLIQS